MDGSLSYAFVDRPVTDPILRVFASEVMLPSQFLATRRAELTGVSLLCLEILCDAYQTVLRAAQCYPPGRRLARLSLDDWKWIFSRESDWPFSFVSCCEAIGCDPDWMRKGIDRQCALARQGSVKLTPKMTIRHVRKSYATSTVLSHR